jgi:hypothetical protein
MRCLICGAAAAASAAPFVGAVSSSAIWPSGFQLIHARVSGAGAGLNV